MHAVREAVGPVEAHVQVGIGQVENRMVVDEDVGDPPLAARPVDLLRQDDPGTGGQEEGERGGAAATPGPRVQSSRILHVDRKTVRNLRRRGRRGPQTTARVRQNCHRMLAELASSTPRSELGETGAGKSRFRRLAFPSRHGATTRRSAAHRPNGPPALVIPGELSMSVKRQDALDYHAVGRPGKIAVIPSKPAYTQRDLGLAYSPGV